jgi:hypothetical protein
MKHLADFWGAELWGGRSRNPGDLQPLENVTGLNAER